MSEKFEKNGGEKNYDYFVNNPEDLTIEDLDKLDVFLNNFHLRIFDRERLKNSNDENEKKLGESIEQALTETAFPIDQFELLSESMHPLRVEASDALNSFDMERYRDIEKKLKPLSRSRQEMLLPLYKKLREMGFEHYPTLTV